MANDLNRSQFRGNLTRNPEIRYTNSGQAVVDVGLANNRSWKDKNTDDWKEEVTYINLVAWGKLAEKIAETYVKGEAVEVEARYSTDSWDDKTTGEKRTAPKFTITDIVKLLRNKKSDSEGESRGGNNRPASQNNSSDDDDDIPF